MEKRFRTSLKDDECGKQRPSHDSHFRRKRLPSSNKQESSREYSRFTNSSSEDKSFRSSPKRRKETRISITAEAKIQISKNCPESINDEASKFIQELKAVPTEVYTKLVYMKLDQIEMHGVNGLSEISEIAKFITKGEEVIFKSIPPGIANIIRKEMLNETQMNPPASATVASSQNPQSNPSFSHGQVKFPYPSTYTPSSNESFPYNTASSSRTPAIESFAYNSASSSRTPAIESFAYNSASSSRIPAIESFAYNSASSNKPPVIPGLTSQEEQRESHSSYSAYVSKFSALIPKL